MKRQHIFLFLTLVLLLSGSTIANAQTTPPKWKSMGVKDLRNSYLEVVSGVASKIDEARDKAAQEIVRRRNLTADATLNVRVVDGKITSSGSRDLVVSARILDEYVEPLVHEGYRVYMLVQTLKHPSFSYENVVVSDDYPFSARAFVPGMDQLYKGQKTKGVLFIAGEVVCVGGIVLAENMRLSNENLIGSTYNVNQRITYTDNANLWSNIRNGCIAAAAAVYVWNIIDAAASKGGRYVDVVSLTPYAGTETAGLALTINF